MTVTVQRLDSSLTGSSSDAVPIRLARATNSAANITASSSSSSIGSFWALVILGVISHGETLEILTVSSSAKSEQFGRIGHPSGGRKASIRLGLSHHLPSLMWPTTDASFFTIRTKTAILSLSVRIAYVPWRRSLSNQTCIMQNSSTYATSKPSVDCGVLRTSLNSSHGVT